MDTGKANKKTHERRKERLKNKLTHNRKEGLSDDGNNAKRE